MLAQPPAPAPDMPASLVMQLAEELHLDALSSGALMSLCWAFWRGKARPLPTDDAALAVLAKCHLRRWNDVRSRVLSAFKMAEPELSSVYAKSVANMTRILAYSARGGRTAQARKREARQATMPKDVSLVDQAASGPLVPAKDFTTAVVFDIKGAAIPKRVIRNSAARLTDRT